jgi:hypothetical protein
MTFPKLKFQPAPEGFFGNQMAGTGITYFGTEVGK